MTLRRKYAMAVFFFSFAALASAQPEQYYYDPVLLNGKIYVFHVPPGTKGHQFLAQSEFSSGKLSLKGVDYDNVMLNYDIYNQQVLLKYADVSGVSNPIIMSDAWIGGFSVNNKDFDVISSSDSLKQFYQTLGSGPYKVLYTFRKKLELSQVHGASNRVFSEPIRRMYLFHEGTRTEYRNNRSFLGLFNKEKRNRIREFLRRNRINVKKSDDKEIRSLVSFINSPDE
ncbi:MAG TPA: hypothetical protein VHO68_06935 [Bacteroidales bacterium]|nr:hypothetical protein [Bacteroidales bacterium]